MRLIDADELKKELIDMDFVLVNHNVEDWIDEQPTVDEEPVRNGKWERVEYSFVGGYRCSCCGSKALDDSFNYCGYCGEKMDGE